MIFIDTSLIVAYANAEDEFHSRAVEIVTEIDGGKYGMGVITDYIFDEIMTTLLARTRNLKLVVENGNKLLDATLFINLNIDSDIFGSTWKIFKEQQKSRLSFTDCSIIATCRANGIANLATFDRALKESSKLTIVD
ncbi:MAG: type II toxin-antitoxin system VapC family toxin [Candidatus Micrarchaeota archaeon]|nr:PIN domain-containing protein [Planctomycetota bacterium]MDE1822869.1 type II toxin-antitoxin system VapC family toxin [Candidatus Micrarchaeota archaeon]MDE1849514.1 type II toxin-antitoxin system VapC family toxin [Candidatus Micrarchaeota archaeon]